MEEDYYLVMEWDDRERVDRAHLIWRDFPDREREVEAEDFTKRLVIGDDDPRALAVLPLIRRQADSPRLGSSSFGDHQTPNPARSRFSF